MTEIFTSAWKGRTQILGAGHEDTIFSLQYLALIAQQENDLSQAKYIFEQLLSIRIEKYGESHIETIENMVTLAKIQSQLGKRHESINLYNKILNEQIRTLGLKEGETLDTFRILVQLLQEDGRVDEVTHLYDTVIGENVNIGKAGAGVNSASFVQLMDNYAVILLEQGRREEANDILRLVVQVYYDSLH
jgi:tetratricopeptide (TPR) repeat protein